MKNIHSVIDKQYESDILGYEKAIGAIQISADTFSKPFLDPSPERGMTLDQTPLLSPFPNSQPLPKVLKQNTEMDISSYYFFLFAFIVSEKISLSITFFPLFSSFYLKVLPFYDRMY